MITYEKVVEYLNKGREVVPNKARGVLYNPHSNSACALGAILIGTGVNYLGNRFADGDGYAAARDLFKDTLGTSYDQIYLINDQAIAEGKDGDEAALAWLKKKLI